MLKVFSVKNERKEKLYKVSCKQPIFSESGPPIPGKFNTFIGDELIPESKLNDYKGKPYWASSPNSFEVVSNAE